MHRLPICPAPNRQVLGWSNSLRKVSADNRQCCRVIRTALRQVPRSSIAGELWHVYYHFNTSPPSITCGCVLRRHPDSHSESIISPIPHQHFVLSLFHSSKAATWIACWAVFRHDDKSLQRSTWDLSHWHARGRCIRTLLLGWSLLRDFIWYQPQYAEAAEVVYQVAIQEMAWCGVLGWSGYTRNS